MNIEQVRFNMVEQQIRTWDVLDTDVLDLLHVIKRETFVPTEQREYALMDIETPLTPVSKTQKMWSPRMEARILQDIALDGSEHVLEVGTGSGYLTALLAARSNKVTSVEIDPALTAFAAENLRRAKISNVSLHTGDAAHGF
ncbi:MAG: methyltransferase domain-containing protein, partial [Burkholderiales bacterium]